MPVTSGRFKMAFVRSLVLLLACQGFTSHAEAQVTDRLREFFGANPQTPHPAVVRVVAQESGASSMGSGCLIWVDGDYGWVVSNWHVVRGATGPIEVIFPDGFRSPAHVTKTDETWDLALLGIWRPRVSPVSLADRIPQVGEELTIAGYGQGPYRQAHGTCRHYAAPDPYQPHEMIELAVTARQGDSGGPILNSRGELAGVLFGSGSGMTTGSHIGRVKTFLADVGSTQLSSTAQELGNRAERQPSSERLPVPNPPAIAALTGPPRPIASAPSTAATVVPPAFFPSSHATRPTQPQQVESRPLPMKELETLQISDSDPLPFEELIASRMDVEAVRAETERFAEVQNSPAPAASHADRTARLDDPSESGWKSRAAVAHPSVDRPKDRPDTDRNPFLLEVQGVAEDSHAPSLPTQQPLHLHLPLPLTDTNAFLVFVSLVATLIYALPRGTSKERPGSNTMG